MTKKPNPRGNNRPHEYEGRNVFFEIASGRKECGSEGGEVLIIDSTKKGLNETSKP